MKLNDRLIGILAILGGIAIISGTFGFREIPGQQFGSAFFPRIIGVVAMLAGLVQIFTANGGPAVTIPAELRGRGVFVAAAVLIGIVLWILLAPLLGFLLITPLLIFTLAMIMGGRALPALAVSIGVTVLFYLIFSSLLRVPLPRGMIEGWLL